MFNSCLKSKFSLVHFYVTRLKNDFTYSQYFSPHGNLCCLVCVLFSFQFISILNSQTLAGFYNHKKLSLLVQKIAGQTLNHSLCCHKYHWFRQAIYLSQIKWILTTAHTLFCPFSYVVYTKYQRLVAKTNIVYSHKQH